MLNEVLQIVVKIGGSESPTNAGAGRDSSGGERRPGDLYLIYT
jgi:hypothetical protein